MATDSKTPQSNKCPDCNGEGWTWIRIGEMNARAECLRCEGEGDVRYRTDNNDSDSKVSAPPEIRSTDGLDEQAAAHEYVESVKGTADNPDEYGLMWHGWALREAFVKGIEWERRRSSS